MSQVYPVFQQRANQGAQWTRFTLVANALSPVPGRSANYLMVLYDALGPSPSRGLGDKGPRAQFRICPIPFLGV